MITYAIISAHCDDGTIINQYKIDCKKSELDSLKTDYPFLCTQGSRARATDNGKAYICGANQTWEETK